MNTNNIENTSSQDHFTRVHEYNLLLIVLLEKNLIKAIWIATAMFCIITSCHWIWKDSTQVFKALMLINSCVQVGLTALLFVISRVSKLYSVAAARDTMLHIINTNKLSK